jgi:hypothetical protein
MLHPINGQTAPRTRLLLSSRPLTWQGRAVQNYPQTERGEQAGLRADMAARIAALTERTIALESIYIDYATQTATVAVDGFVFQQRRDELVLLRHCDECGIGRFTSPPIHTLADLGYALSAWEPLCQQCQPEDPINWLERED